METQDESFDALMETAWLGEISGDALFRAAAAKAEDPAQSAKWLRLAEVEQLVRDELEPFIEDKSREKIIEARERGEGFAATFTGMPWLEALASFEPATKPAIERFVSMRALASATTRDAVELLVEHEVALQDFADLELAGKPDAADRAIDAFFAKWQRAPSASA